MDANQEAFVHDSPGNVQSFLDAVNTIKPTAIIGKKHTVLCAHTKNHGKNMYSFLRWFFFSSSKTFALKIMIVFIVFAMHNGALAQ